MTLFAGITYKVLIVIVFEDTSYLILMVMDWKFTMEVKNGIFRGTGFLRSSR